MKRLIFPAVGGLLLAAAALPQWATSQDDRYSEHQNSAAAAANNSNDHANRRDNERSADSNQAVATDDDEIEFRGMEHAALGVLLSERAGAQGGVRIREALENSPANRAGLQAGDQISQIDGKPMKTYGDVIRFINRVRPGQRAVFVIRRDNQDMNVNVTFATREEVWGHDEQSYAHHQDRDAQHRFRDSHDRTARNADQSQRRWSYHNQDDANYGQQATLGVGLESERGVPIIRRVQPGSPAEQAGLQAGDEIVAVGNQQVRNHADLLNALSRYEPGDQVDILVQQDGRNHTMRVRLAGANTANQQNVRGNENFGREGYRTGSTRLEGVQPDGFRRDGFQAGRKIEEER